MTGLEYILSLHEVCQFQSREGAKTGKASNSEIRRWLKNGAVVVNHFKLAADEEIDYPIFSVYLFPKNKVTLL